MTAHLSILGCGTMGRAILGGLMASDERSQWTYGATVRHADRARSLAADLPIDVGTDNLAEAQRADVVVLAVKPQNVADLLKAPGMAEALEGRLVFSIAAGVTLATLQRLVPGARWMRAMPNTPSIVRQGMTVVAEGDRAAPGDHDIAMRIFSSIGRVVLLDEKHFDVVTGLSGSGPAFVCVMLEAMADGAVMMGMPRDTAVELAAQTLLGTAQMVLETGQHPAALRDRVTTPAGCTIAGLFMMEEGRVRSTLARTIQEAAQVASGLGGPCE